MRFFRKKIVPLLLIIAALGGFSHWQKNNLSILSDGAKLSSEELLAKIEEAQTEGKTQISETPEISVRELTSEEALALKEGSIDREELIDRLVEPILGENGAEASGKNAEYRELLSKLVAEALVLKSEYGGKVETLLEQARKELKAMTENGVTKTGLLKWAGRFFKEVRGLGKSGDLDLDGIKEKIGELAEKYNADPSSANELIEQIKTEKGLKISWFLSELLKNVT